MEQFNVDIFKIKRKKHLKNNPLLKVWLKVKSFARTVVVSLLNVLTLVPRPWTITILTSLILTLFTLLIFRHISYDSSKTINLITRFCRNLLFPTAYEQLLEQKLELSQLKIAYLESRYQIVEEALVSKHLKVKVSDFDLLKQRESFPTTRRKPKADNSAIKNQLRVRNNLIQSDNPTMDQLLPYLKDTRSLWPTYHMASSRTHVDFIIGVPTVRRYNASYLKTTLKYLVKALSKSEARNTLIIVLIGETDMEYVVREARSITQNFPKQVESGLIEVIAPPFSYYPDFSKLTPTLNNTLERTAWRSKQNLDCIFLMNFAKSKGTYYLTMEDDVISKKYYMREIKRFIAMADVLFPRWIIIQFSPVGGIGKLFKCSQLIYFITYVYLFYGIKPIDWMIQSYLADKVCDLHDTFKQCRGKLNAIQPQYDIYIGRSIFQHIGRRSSLRGKVQPIRPLSWRWKMMNL